MDRGGWQATVHGVAEESDMTYRLNGNSFRPEIHSPHQPDCYLTSPTQFVT